MSDLSEQSERSSLVRRLMAQFARARRYAKFDDADGTADVNSEAAPDQNRHRLQPQQQQQQHRSRRYSTESSSGRRVVGPNHVTSPSSPGIYGAVSLGNNHTMSVKYQQQQPLRRGVSGTNQQRQQLIRQMREDLGKPDVNDTSGGNTNSEIDENVERGNWTSQLDFLLSCLGYAVGLGNVWRFPYLCFIHGGGAFLVPYTIFLFLCGIPVFLLELSLGQFTSEGPVTCWEFAPLFTGVGYAMVFYSTVVSFYYNMIIAYSIYYLFASMSNPLPWSNCANSWNTDMCSQRMPLVECSPSQQQPNGTCYNGTKLLGIFNETLFHNVEKLSRVLPADEYFNHAVLKKSDSIDNFGTPDWKLVLCLLAAWVIIFCCMVKGIKQSGKIVYFTALFPYVVLFILFFRGVTLHNAREGIRFYIVPDFSKLANADVWKDAAGQIFFSLSCSWGGMISLSSYNRFHTNVIRDTLFVTLANCATSVFAGFVIFSFIGHLAGSLGVDVKDVTQSGFGLAFVIYPEAVNLLPGSSFWAILFFIMILTLGVDSQFAMVETIITSACDKFHVLRRHKAPLIGCICFASFLLGLPFCCPGGGYLMEIVDNYCGSWSILMLGLIECVALGWVYGRPGCGSFHRFSVDIGLMMRRPIWPVWRFLWQYVSPSLIFCIIVFNWIRYTRTEYVKGSGKFFPIWADALGWLLAMASIVLIIGGALVELLREPSGTPWMERLFCLSIPSYRWGPALPRHRMLMAPYLERLGVLRHFYLHPREQIKYQDVFPSQDEAETTPDRSSVLPLEVVPAEARLNRDLERGADTTRIVSHGANSTEV